MRTAAALGPQAGRSPPLKLLYNKKAARRTAITKTTFVIILAIIAAAGGAIGYATTHHFIGERAATERAATERAATVEQAGEWAAAEFDRRAAAAHEGARIGNKQAEVEQAREWAAAEFDRLRAERAAAEFDRLRAERAAAERAAGGPLEQAAVAIAKYRIDAAIERIDSAGGQLRLEAAIMLGHAQRLSGHAQPNIPAATITSQWIADINSLPVNDNTAHAAERIAHAAERMVDSTKRLTEAIKQVEHAQNMLHDPEVKVKMTEPFITDEVRQKVNDAVGALGDQEVAAYEARMNAAQEKFDTAHESLTITKTATAMAREAEGAADMYSIFADMAEERAGRFTELINFVKNQ